MADHQFALKSGRRIGVSAAGDPLSGRLVVFCHPTPGAGKFDPNPLLTNRWGIRFLMLDRPGYGGSDPLAPGEMPTVEQRADDIAEYLMRSERSARSLHNPTLGAVGVVGWGAGGTIALSLAARHPELVDRAVTVGTRMPVRAMPSTASPTQPLPLRVLARSTLADFQDVLATRGPMSAEWLGIAHDDPAYHNAGVSGQLERLLGEASRQGTIGVATDLVAADNVAWSNELDRITAATVLVYGDADPVATRQDGRWFQRHIDNARVAIVADAGRLAVVSAWRRILQHVAPQHGGIPRSRRDSDV